MKHTQLLSSLIIGVIIGSAGVAGYFLFLAPLADTADTELIIATTTSTYDSGLLDNITASFLADHPGVNISFVSVGTGQAIATAKLGDADLLLVHDRVREEAFVNEGYGVHRASVMYNDFIIVGPTDSDPAGILGLSNVTEAFILINQTGSTFTSRGDGSGTNAAELRLWDNAGVNVSTVPSPSWYLELGQGMGDTLVLASTEGGYCFTDRGTYLALKDNLDLRVMVENDQVLLNPYGAIPVDPGRFPHVNYELAIEYVLFLISDQGASLINGFQVGGEQLFIHHYGNTTDTIGETAANHTQERNYWDALLLNSGIYSRTDNTLGVDAPALTMIAAPLTQKNEKEGLMENFNKAREVLLYGGIHAIDNP
jgi:tungstate transport system substrate-binding protein